MGKSLLVLCALTIGGLASAGPPPDEPTIRWAESWKAALAEAKYRNVPILVTFHKDG